MDDCIFCKIAQGKIPCDVVLETETVIAFLDINPAVPGHTLVVPKRHSADVTEIEPDDLSEVAKTTKKIGILLKTRLSAAGFNILSANGSAAQQTVFHTHFHVVPRYENDERNLWFHGKGEQTPREAVLKKLTAQD